MKLYTNGCSFTWGAEIIENQLGFSHKSINHENPSQQDKNLDKFRREHVWPYFLNQKLSSNSFTNESVGGACNKRIFRTTMDFFIDLINSGDSVNDYIAVIQWTEIQRFEVYDNIIDDYVFLSIRGTWFGKKQIGEYINDRYDTLSRELLQLDDLNSLEDLKSYITALAGFFEKHKIKYVFLSMHPNCIKKLPSYYLNNYNWLGIDIDESSITHHLKKEGNNTQKYFYPQGHPTIQGHQLVAEKLYNRLQELYTL